MRVTCRASVVQAFRPRRNIADPGASHACSALGAGRAAIQKGIDRVSCRILRVAVAVVAVILPSGLVPAATRAAPVPTITMVSAGDAHACALTASGGVKCWGGNRYGQLGDGTTTDSPNPVDVVGLRRGVIAIAAGDGHTCALTSSGGVKCWGATDAYELRRPIRAGATTCGQEDPSTGSGIRTCSRIPVDIQGLTSGVTAIAAGPNHTCALTSAGGVKCWGNNDSGQLGNGSTIDRLKPGYVVGLTSGVRAIATGRDHTCALKTDGGVSCWGANGASQRVGRPATDRLKPFDVSGLAGGITAIAVGCAITRGGMLQCWDFNDYGQLGDRTTTVPIDVPGLAGNVTAIAGGAEHNCALTRGGGVKCWGNNFFGELGNGTTTDSREPVDVSGLASGVSAIAVGADYTCAVTSRGGVKCWGLDYAGQLGTGATTDSTPLSANGLPIGLVPVDIDFAHQRPPAIDAVDGVVRDGRIDLPLLAVVAGLAAGLRMLVRRRSELARAASGPMLE